MKQKERLVLALGGNAILRPKQEPGYETQKENIEKSAALLANLITMGYDLIITHGNGPQVGNLLLQNEIAACRISPMPLDVLGAKTQGFIGYMIGQAVNNELRKNGTDNATACLVTTVEVSPDDPAFHNPTKPVGGFFSKEEAEKMQTENGWDVVEDSGRGYRRVVPSPQPINVPDLPVIKSLLDRGISVIAGGGGGIPVINEDGEYRGITAVIDKDLTSCLLAKQLEADKLFILTDVPNVYVGYGTPAQRALGNVTLDEMQSHIDAGEFAAGSMGPKIEGAMEFVRNTGNTACICALGDVADAVKGNAGTRIIAQ